jgi:polygalacturonase
VSGLSCPRGLRRPRVVGTVGLAIVASLALAACGGGDSSSAGSPGTSPSAGAVLPGGGLSVAEAIASDAEPPLAVTGWVVRTGDGARLCSGYEANADEPCAEPSLALIGEVAEGTGDKVSLLGAVEGGSFVVSSTTQG